MTISISGLDTYDVGFFFNSSGLQYNQSTGGWMGKLLMCLHACAILTIPLACDWWHGVPQLFQVNGYLDNGFGLTGLHPPAGCSKVQLQPVAV